MAIKQNPAARGNLPDGPIDETPAVRRGSPQFPIVGIGASAGGLAAFEAFFSTMPESPPMAFVLVQHLAPDHKSMLTDLIQRYTSMKVFEVEDGMVAQPGCTYIIPPNRDMAFLNGVLQLLEPNAPRGQRMPIDFFFRSLAQDQGERAIGIVLSGTGSDGTAGIRAIKGAAGMVMAQSPATTEFSGMPSSAIATGLVDFVLPPQEMPAQLATYISHAFGNRIRLPSLPLPSTENALRKIFILLRNQTSHDFSQYKPSTVHRRIERRMAVHRLESVEEYAKFLQQTPTEVEALFRDLLIGVTSFFRDPEVFKALEEQVLPQLFANRSASDPIRVWSMGCSTGEEAYSIAILLAEHQEANRRNFKIQIFATDIDNQAIAAARTGRYPASIAADISPERLARFFTVEPDNSAYRVHKSIRDLLVFSEQNVVKDPPFSRLDLISCRNVLIYMSTELQHKIIPLFHYALKPNGFLCLGTSETVGEFADQFAVLDRKQKLFQRKGALSGSQRVTLGRYLPHSPMTDMSPPLPRGKQTTVDKPSLKEVTEQTLLREFAPAAVLVNAQGDIFYQHGRTGMYLEPAPGEAGVNNVLKMAREGLRRDLTTALYKAATDKETVRCRELLVRTNGHFTAVNLTVTPVSIAPTLAPDTPLFLVALEQAPPSADDRAQAATATVDEGAKASPTDVEASIALLKRELRSKEEYLQNTNEELETSNEELKSANEEMQSVNEELQSTNEELETSKEELQSLNEELATVNTELQTKVTDLSRANNDMNNLLAGTCIGTVFVDFQLRILRFTPAATHIINLISGDVGRPVGHIVSNLVGYNALVADTQQVLSTLIPKELEVQTVAGAWYTMRILPYRTLDNVIEGAVITFVDISEIKRAREAVRESELTFRTVINTIPEVVFAVDASYRLVVANQAFDRATAGAQPASVVPGGPRFPQEFAPEVSALWRSYYERAFCGETFSVESAPIATDRTRQFESTLTPVTAATGEVNAVVVMCRDNTDKKQPTEMPGGRVPVK